METGCLFLCLEVRKSNVFEAVKESVTTRQAVEIYGVPVGRNGMVCCPFHDDKHPSMKVDRRFHCFGCQADGDVIDFTTENQRGTALPAGGAEMFPGAVRLSASAGTMGTGIRPADAGRSVEPAVRGGPAKETVYGVSAGYFLVRQYGGTGQRDCRVWKRGEED